MARLAIPAALAAAAMLGACAAPERVATNDPNTSRNAAGTVSGQPILHAHGAPVAGGQPLVPASSAFKPGAGTVESIALVHYVPISGGSFVPQPSPSAGATGERGIAYRLTIRMDDGSYQAVDQSSREFLVGDRVAIAGDGRVTRR